MPLAATHIFSMMIVGNLILKFLPHYRQYFPRYRNLFIGLSGLVSDLDMPFHIAFYVAGAIVPAWFQHGGVLHTPFFAILLGILGMLLWGLKKPRASVIVFTLSVAVLLHISLDFFLGGGSGHGIWWLFPFSQQGWSLNLYAKIPIPHIAILVDSAFIIGWLWWVEYSKDKNYSKNNTNQSHSNQSKRQR